MVLEFIITPHTKNIIIGRGLGKDDILICSAKVCLQREKEIGNMLMEGKGLNPIIIDPDWGKEIEVLGFVMCPRCNYKVLYPDHVGEYDINREDEAFLLCPSCNRKIPIKDDKRNYVIIWTTKVVSKHRRHKHCYYHKPCWENGFFVGTEE